MTSEYRHDPHSCIDPYEGDEPMWSGEPNGALVDEASSLTPTSVIDIGAGEGADAVWLAERGWRVVAVEPSPVAARRAREAAAARGVEVRVVEATLADAQAEGLEGADLVTLSYPALFRGSEARLLELAQERVIAVFHADVDRERAIAHGFDPDELLGPDQLRAALADAWVVEVDEQRARHQTRGAGAHHLVDVVIVARRA